MILPYLIYTPFKELGLRPLILIYWALFWLEASIGGGVAYFTLSILLITVCMESRLLFKRATKEPAV